ncbi:DsrE/DsrF/DrsH-like family protein (plasmid) [Bacillus sp. N447-1]|uniref:DsrE/DsrF/DrsH-like family protein n=1 Tax=Bacillus sp. N447-1 TaxID=2789208 RepID=UPI001F60A260|nr:DsrE/DsrF/DrsH-like family protein [Bacillus sp. N447-1]UNT71646.1 DsrE/DsrF/DrsH-like family protein [Bacillus sp. N447-1]
MARCFRTRVGGNTITKLAIIASNGDLFSAYKVLNIAISASAANYEVSIFFAFEGIQLLHKEANQQLVLPEGKEASAEGFQKSNVPSIPELVDMAKELGVNMIACQMTMDVMNLEKEDLVKGIKVAGAITYLVFAKDANITLSF